MNQKVRYSPTSNLPPTPGQKLKSLCNKDPLSPQLQNRIEESTALLQREDIDRTLVHDKAHNCLIKDKRGNSEFAVCK